MKIYNLAYVDTQKGFTPEWVRPFVSEELASQEMLKEISKESGIPIDQLQDGYDEDGWCVGYNYARDYTANRYWEIYEAELPLRESIIGNLIEAVHKVYIFPRRFDHTLYRLIDEYSNSQLESIKSEADFIEENIIGEALYQNACAVIGGNPDEKTYGVIINFLNDHLCEMDIHPFAEWQLSEAEKKEIQTNSTQRWFLAMLMICSGEDEALFVSNVRTEIDNRQPYGEKVFIQEKLQSLKSNFDLPKNHRELCSTLTDEQYVYIMEIIFGRKFKFNDKDDTLTVKLQNFYESATYYLFKAIRKHGFDKVYETYYNGVIAVKKDGNNGWSIFFVGSAEDVASATDKAKKKLNL